MAKRKVNSVRKRRTTVGRGLVGDVLGKVGRAASSVINKGIDLLPVELHVPGYSYCGPGTDLKKRLARGDKGVNKLDEACKAHDIAYSKYSDSGHHRLADRQLANSAWARVKASDASLGEKAAAWAVTTAMNAKAKLGGGGRRKVSGSGKRSKKKKNSKRGKGLYLRPWKGSGGKVTKRGGGKRRGCCKKKKRSQ